MAVDQGMLPEVFLNMTRSTRWADLVRQREATNKLLRERKGAATKETTSDAPPEDPLEEAREQLTEARRVASGG